MEKVKIVVIITTVILSFLLSNVFNIFPSSTNDSLHSVEVIYIPKKPMYSTAYVLTFCDGDSLMFLLTMINSLKEFNKFIDIAVLVQMDVEISVKRILTLMDVDPIRTEKSCERNNIILDLWNLTQYEKIVYFSNSVLLNKNADILFQCTYFCAYEEIHNRHYFSSKIMVLHPSHNDFVSLSKHLITDKENISHVLNAYFGGTWRRSYVPKELPSLINVMAEEPYPHSHHDDSLYDYDIIVYHDLCLPWQVIGSNREHSNSYLQSSNHNSTLFETTIAKWNFGIEKLINSSYKIHQLEQRIISSDSDVDNTGITGIHRQKAWLPYWKNMNRSADICKLNSPRFDNRNNRERQNIVNNKFSVLIATYSRWEVCKLLIYHYGQSQYVDRIFVTWHNPLSIPPDDIRSTSYFNAIYGMKSVYRKFKAFVEVSWENKVLYRTSEEWNTNTAAWWSSATERQETKGTKESKEDSKELSREKENDIIIITEKLFEGKENVLLAVYATEIEQIEEGGGGEGEEEVGGGGGAREGRGGGHDSHGVQIGYVEIGEWDIARALKKNFKSASCESREDGNENRFCYIGTWFEVTSTHAERSSANNALLVVSHAKLLVDIRIIIPSPENSVSEGCFDERGNRLVPVSGYVAGRIQEQVHGHCSTHLSIRVIRGINIGVSPKEVFILPSYGYNSLNNRFNPNENIRTSAVLMIDDDTRVTFPDVELAFRTWLSNPDRIVGPYKRHYSLRGMNGKFKKWGYDFVSNRNAPLTDSALGDPRDVSFEDLTIYPYSIILTKFMFFHVKYLWIYTCLTPPIGHKIVDEYRNGEDILFNMVVSSFSGLAPVAVSVKVDDFGVFNGGISLASSHKDTRSLIITQFCNIIFNDNMPLLTSVLNVGTLETEYHFVSVSTN